MMHVMRTGMMHYIKCHDHSIVMVTDGDVHRVHSVHSFPNLFVPYDDTCTLTHQQLGSREWEVSTQQLLWPVGTKLSGLPLLTGGGSYGMSRRS